MGGQKGLLPFQLSAMNEFLPRVVNSLVLHFGWEVEEEEAKFEGHGVDESERDCLAQKHIEVCTTPFIVIWICSAVSMGQLCKDWTTGRSFAGFPAAVVGVLDWGRLKACGGKAPAVTFPKPMQLVLQSFNKWTLEH